VIGTTSEVGFLESIGMCDAFSATYHVPKLKKEDAKKVMKYSDVSIDFVLRNNARMVSLVCWALGNAFGTLLDRSYRDLCL
jgi:hypothetical protein